MLTPSTAHLTASVGLRALLWLALVVVEMLVVSVLFDFTSGLPEHQNPVFYVTRVARWAAVAVPLFVLLVWRDRQALAADWSALRVRRSLAGALALNLSLFAMLAVASAMFTDHAAAAASPPWHLLPFLGALLGGTLLSLIAMIVPLQGLLAFGLAWRRPLSVAAASGVAIVVLAEAARMLWQSMAGTTLALSAAILRLYETKVEVDPVERTLRVGDFGVVVWDACSGYEGLALVAGFVALYLWTFRSELRFPHALLLFPIGLAGSFILNSVRIAALTSIGAHVSPDMAVRGFHSQAGWIAFLLISIAVMALARPLGLRVSSSRGTAGPLLLEAARARSRATETYLLPFAALMIGSMAMAAAAPHDRPVYVLKAFLVGLALWAVRKGFQGWRLEWSRTAISVGFLVGIAWIATAQPTEPGDALGAWLQEVGPGLAAMWLIVRGIGTIVLVPVAEELAFRGYLYRRMISRDFMTVSPSKLSWVALVLSSVLFGVLHDRWIAGALAGIAFGLVMVRTGRLGDAILAHAVANALIFGWALALRQWSLI